MNDILTEELEYQSKIKPRNGFAAFLFSLLLPGLGQVYNGQWKKGILLFCSILLTPLLFGLTRTATFFYGYLLLCIILLLIRLYAVIDAIKYARKQKLYIPRSYNAWYYQLFIALAMAGILWFYDSKAILGIQSFNMATPANEPTVQVGDKVIADMKAYKNARPQYGDIVIFKKDDNYIYTFRIVGLPNDTLSITDNIVSVNGIQSRSTFIKETIVDEMDLMEFEEQFPNGNRHRIYKQKKPFDSSKSTIKMLIVPADNYYLLGDNRDNASDSRYEGSVNSNNILGRIVYSYWGRSKDRINIDFRNR